MRPSPPARRLTCGRANPLWRGGDAICKIVDSRTHSRFVLRILSSRRLSALSRQTPRFSISLFPADIPGSFSEFDCTRRLSAFRPVPSIFYLIDFSGHSRFVLRISIVRRLSAFGSANPANRGNRWFQGTFQVRSRYSGFLLARGALL